MMRFSKNVVTTILIVVLAFVGGANRAESSGKYAGDFLALGTGARALGMGSAFVVVTDGAASSYYNPAGLARLKTKEINFMHSEQFAGLINYNTVSVASPMTDRVSMGITLLHSGIGNIKYTRLVDPSKPMGEDNRPEVASREDATDYALYVSSAKQVTDRLGIGGSVKIIRRSIGPDTAFGYGIDLGAQYRISDNWRIGAALRDATGTTVAWDGRSNDRIAAILDAGVSFTGEAPWVGGGYFVTGSMLFFGDSPDTKGLSTMYLGGEYHIGDFLAFRAGSSAGAGTFGLGLMRLPLISATSFDYAFLSDDGLDSTHRVSMSVKF